MTLEELLNKYPKIFKPYKGNPRGCNWSCPTGWLNILDWLCGCMQEYIDTHESHSKDGVYKPEQVECLQVKEKFAGLRFYTSGHDSNIEGMIKFAEYLCWNTCQLCGTMENVKLRGDRWMWTLCETCYEKTKK